MNREQELWAVALWVEKHHPDDGPEFVGDQVRRQVLAGDGAGVAPWCADADRYDAPTDGADLGRQ